MTLCEKCIHGDICADRRWMDRDDERALVECCNFKNKEDFMEVIRCKNCIKHSTDDCIVNRKRDLMCHRTTTKAIGFCSEGERKVVTDKNVGGK